VAEERSIKIRELFIEELAEIVGGGGPEDYIPEVGRPDIGLCAHWNSTMACGEEGPPCPSGC